MSNCLTTPLESRVSNRTNGVHEPGITKTRIIMVIHARDTDVQVVASTAFGGAGEPLQHLRNDFARLKHEDDDSEPESALGLPAINYHGAEYLLPKVTFTRLNCPFWLSLKKTPTTRAGRLVSPDHEKVATSLKLDETHPSYREGKRLEDQRRARSGDRIRPIAPEQSHSVVPS